MKDIVLIAHNLRSCHNVGSLLRTADGLGVTKVYLTGYTPYPQRQDDGRLPHIAAKAHRQIAKTALGAERFIQWEWMEDVFAVINLLRRDGYTVAALEQADNATEITSWAVPPKTAVIVGREAEGLEPDVLKACSVIVEIPMHGKKESFNVVQAAAMGLFYCFFSKP